MAEAIFRKKVKDAGLEGKIDVDSAGTGDWHVGKQPHEGTINILNEYHIDHDGITARQVEKKDLQTFDYIVAMDASNMNNLQKLKGEGEVNGKMFRLLDLVPEKATKDVPDPYFTGNFEEVYNLINIGCDRLLDMIKKEKIK